MGDSQANLVTSCTFKGREYLVKMNVINGNLLELVVTDKFTAEDWSCSYDVTYIENQTHKTGNFKQFDIFVAMLRSGLLKTRDSVSVDLLTVDDLEQLRSRHTLHGRSSFTPRTSSSNHLLPSSNRRYLILTYTVEFDRIHYPLPLEYCGPPDPKILQAVIRRLEAEVTRLQDQLRNPSDSSAKVSQVKVLEKRVEELAAENRALKTENSSLNRTSSACVSSNHKLESLQKGMRFLEEHVKKERLSFNKLICRLREEKKDLSTRVQTLQSTESGLRKRLNAMHRAEGPLGNRVVPRSRSHSRETFNRWDEAPHARSQEIKTKVYSSPKNLASRTPYSEAVHHSKTRGENHRSHRSNSASSTESRRQPMLNTRNEISSSHQRGRVRLRDRYVSPASSIRSVESFHLCERSKGRDGSVNSKTSSKSSSSQRHKSRHTMTAQGTKTSPRIPHSKTIRARRTIVNDLETRINALQDVLRGDKTYQ